LIRYAQEASWREDRRREPNGSQVNRVATLARDNKPSVDFSGYWQRHLEELRPVSAIPLGLRLLLLLGLGLCCWQWGLIN